MLTIRYQRSGRKNHPFFRIVLIEKSKPPKSGFLKILGWYNPITKTSSLNKEEILNCLDKGAIPSNSVAKFLLGNKIKHKLIIYEKAKVRKPRKKTKETPEITKKPVSLAEPKEEIQAKEIQEKDKTREIKEPEGEKEKVDQLETAKKADEQEDKVPTVNNQDSKETVEGSNAEKAKIKEKQIK